MSTGDGHQRRTTGADGSRAREGRVVMECIAEPPDAMLRRRLRLLICGVVKLELTRWIQGPVNPRPLSASANPIL